MEEILKYASIHVPLLLFFMIIFSIGYISIFFAYLKRKHRKSPLRIKLLRLPGETLREQIDELNEDIIFSLTVPAPLSLIILCSLMIAVHLQTYTKEQALVYGLLSFVPIYCYFIYKTVTLMAKRNNLRLGLEAERAVGEELNRLCYMGCRVYHDFPAEKFNIDHILIARNGIFAVETKGRSKSKLEKKNWIVQYKNDQLVFPDRCEKEPPIQARRQAHWLAEFLSKKLQKKIHVTPVLAIPGWYIEIKQKPNNLILTNGSKLEFLLRSRGSIDENTFITVASIIEDRCRNVDPPSFPAIKYY